MAYRRSRGDCFMKLGDTEKAIADYRKVLTENPDSKEDRRALSRALYEAGLYSEAVEGGAVFPPMKLYGYLPGR